MNNKLLLIVGGVGSFMLVAGIGFFLLRPGNSLPQPISTPSLSSSQNVLAQETTTPSPIESTTYTIEEIATHNSDQSCWTAVNGVVYDITNFLDRHPGGKMRIMSVCGIDGTQAFSIQHEGQPRPQAMLKGFEIGQLKK